MLQKTRFLTRYGYTGRIVVYLYQLRSPSDTMALMVGIVGRLGQAGMGFLKFVRTTLGLATIAAIAVFGSIGSNGAPEYYWFTLLAIPTFVLYVLFRRAVAFADARIRAKVRWKAYGPTVERVPYTRFEVFRDTYAEQTRDDEFGYVDDRTWNDLGMNEVHARLDTCFTMAGRNELIRTLRHTLPNQDLRSRRMELMDTLSKDDQLRGATAVTLARVGEERDADPARLLWSDSVGPDKLAPVSLGLGLMAAAFIVIAAAWNLSLGLIGVAVSFFANMTFYYTKARHISTYIPALRVLVRMIEAARTLPWEGLSDLPGRVAAAKRASGWLLTGAPSPSPTFSGDITEAVLLYIKIYFQIDLIAFNRIAATLQKHREVFQEIYQGVGQVDAMLALASYRARRKRTCQAIIRYPGDEARRAENAVDLPMGINLDRAYHPLVSKAIPNSVSLTAPGAIVTGTNMAGKSTFLRTVGINVLFAQTAGYAFASGYEAPAFRVMSSIEKGDDLANGKSFYYDEAERIYLMIEQTKEGEPLLLLIDELLSGTNSLERESASIAILHYLARHNALTVAATHDVAIARGVGDQYALHYFTDNADENGLTFDFKIHEGVVETRNAIKLLRLIGYPENVIRSALGE